MITIGEEQYLLAAEAARHLHISRTSFYRLYKQVLKEHQVGQLRRPHFRLSEIEEANKVKVYPVAS
jgi:hypothetical protein